MLRVPALLLAVVLAAGCSDAEPPAAAPSPSPTAVRVVTPSPTAAPSPCSPAPLPAGSRVSVVGDSYTSGLPETGGVGPKGWPALLAQRTGWRVTTHALTGSGFIAPGLGKDGKTYDGPTFVDLAREVGRSDLVLVFGSLNDLQYLGESGATARYQVAVGKVLASVRSKAPRVVVATTFAIGAPTRSLSEMRDRTRRLSRGRCTDFLDPLDEGWFLDGQLIAGDGEHPSDAGHVRLADLWLRDLTRLGLATS